MEEAVIVEEIVNDKKKVDLKCSFGEYLLKDEREVALYLDGNPLFSVGGDLSPELEPISG